MGKTTVEDMIPTERIQQTIFMLRGDKVLLDRDLARLYGVRVALLIAFEWQAGGFCILARKGNQT